MNTLYCIILFKYLVLYYSNTVFAESKRQSGRIEGRWKLLENDLNYPVYPECSRTEIVDDDDLDCYGEYPNCPSGNHFRFSVNGNADGSSFVREGLKKLF